MSDTGQSVFLNQTNEVRFARVRITVGNNAYEVREVWAVLPCPAHPLDESWQMPDLFLRKYAKTIQRNDALNGTHPQGTGRLPRRDEFVEEEAVVLIPKPGATQGVECVDDRDIVLEKLRDEILINGIDLRKLQCDGEHSGAEKTHPGRAVSLT